MHKKEERIPKKVTINIETCKQREQWVVESINGKRDLEGNTQ